MNRNDYWRKREEEQLKHYLTEEADIQRAMAEKYNYMLYQIQAQINDFYARYARREQITLAEAMQRVSKMDVQAFAAKAKKYVEKRDFSPKANRELRLYNATMRINRLELLKANIGLEMIDGFNDLEHLMDQSLTKRTVDELERQEDILRRDAGILGETIHDNAKTVGSIVNASFNNATWSERIWGNQTQLRNELSSLLTQGLIQGRNPRVLAPALEKMFGVSRRNAERLMATELARVQTDAQMESFKENNIDQYIFLSLDTACSECMALNEKHFPVKDMEPGENAPPIHPNCRCSTAAYIDREAVEREVFGESFEYNPNDERERSIRYGKERVFEQRGGIVNAKEVKTSGNKLYVDNSVTLTRKQIRECDRIITESKKIHGIVNVCNVPIVITNNKGRDASYNPRTNVMFVDAKAVQNGFSGEVQKSFAVPKSEYSTLVHELYHWKDADEYRKSGKSIDRSDFMSPYVMYRRKEGRKRLISAGIDMDDLQSIRRKISYYAYKKALENDWDEVYTEYRTLLLLEKSK